MAGKEEEALEESESPRVWSITRRWMSWKGKGIGEREEEKRREAGEGSEGSEGTEEGAGESEETRSGRCDSLGSLQTKHALSSIL